MKVTVIVPDSFVSVDGEGVTGVDLSCLPSGLHAIQWYGEFGEVEHVDTQTNKAVANETITSFAPYSPVLAAYEARKQAKLVEDTLAMEAAQAAANEPPQP